MNVKPRDQFTNILHFAVLKRTIKWNLFIDTIFIHACNTTFYLRYIDYLILKFNECLYTVFLFSINIVIKLYTEIKIIGNLTLEWKQTRDYFLSLSYIYRVILSLIYQHNEQKTVDSEYILFLICWKLLRPRHSHEV